MKKLTALLVLTLVSQISVGQISTIKIAEPKPQKAEAYDSLRNFLGEDYIQYKGQELYLIPKTESLREYGYMNFIKDIHKYRYDKSNTFKCCDGYNSKYTELQGKYFIVEDVHKYTKPNIQSPYLHLRMKETNEITFFEYDTKYSHSFPFLVVGYYEKQKDIFVGNEILIRSNARLADIETGDEINLTNGEYVKCIQITLDEKYYVPSLLLENDKMQKFLFPLYNRHGKIRRILTKQEAEDYKKRFGEENWLTILDEKVKIGFTTEMTRISWGEPDKINRASYGDQWVYGDQYLYFENGKLLSFN